MIRLVCIVEIANAHTEEEAQHALDHFRESVLPSLEYGITLYRATEADADASLYQQGAHTCPTCGDGLTSRTTRDGQPSYCDTCDREQR